MVYKLVQIDSDNSTKIKLEPGTHVFGRGKFLNINDKRISRQHGQFEVTDDTLIITALHHNPCFYLKSGIKKAVILRQNNSVSLNSGDKLGLLPTSYWYEVLHCVAMENVENDTIKEECQRHTTNQNSVDSGEETDNEGPKSVINENIVSENDNIESQSTEILSPCDLDNHQESNNIEVNSSNQNTSTIDKTDEPGSPSKLSANLEIETTSNESGPSLDQCSALQKRLLGDCEGDQPDAVKKIKREPEDKSDVKSADGEQSGSSNSSDNKQANAPAAPAVPLRERCMYGASCYRRNPVHRAQYSHPQDADWGTGNKAPCPWGATCGKRDPRHWRDHDHPPGTVQPPPQPGMRVVHRQGNVFYINAQSVNFHDDHFEAEDSDGNSVDYDYEF